MLGFKKRNPHREIGPAELDAMLKEGKALLIDVREADEFAIGHITGAINLVISRIPKDERSCCNVRAGSVRGKRWTSARRPRARSTPISLVALVPGKMRDCRWPAARCVREGQAEGYERYGQVALVGGRRAGAIGVR